jgi:hypothetical protein
VVWGRVWGRADVTRATRPPRIPVHVGEHGGTCSGERQILDYAPARAIEPLPGAEDGTYRAAVAVEVAIRPAPPHLRDHTYRTAFVGNTIVLHANTVEELALLLEASADLLVRQVGDRLAVHPRPAPPMGWPT